MINVAAMASQMRAFMERFSGGNDWSLGGRGSRGASTEAQRELRPPEIGAKQVYPVRYATRMK